MESPDSNRQTPSEQVFPSYPAVLKASGQLHHSTASDRPQRLQACLASTAVPH